MEADPAQKLRYRIIECSGEDPSFPASELLVTSSQSRGWQSQRFCSFPQYITFQFLAPVSLSQIQFLCHESKIPSKIEILVALPDLRTPLPYSEIKWKNLGFLSFDPNEKSNFQLRELKTVYVDSPCLYMRILFHKCYPNRFNFFNQVGFIAVVPFGCSLGSLPLKAVRTIQPVSKKNPLAEYESQIDEVTLIKINELEEAKMRAVEAEEFEEAERIKQELLKLQQFGVQLKRLEERKNQAIQNEEFEAANLCKKDIKRIRDVITRMINGDRVKDQSFARGGGGGSKTFDYDHYESRPHPTEQSVMQMQAPRQSMPHLHHNNRDSQASFEQENNQYEEHKNQHEEHYEEQEAEEPQEEQYQRYEPPPVKLAYDDMPLPALAGKKNQEMDEMGEMGTQDLPKEPEELSRENQKHAEPLIPVIGKEICKRIFSKFWNMREEGLQILINELPRESSSQVIDAKDPWMVFMTIMAVVSYTVVDRVNQVSMKAISLLKTLMIKRVPQSGSKSDIVMYIDTVLSVLLEKICDSNIRVREQAEDALMSMVRNPIISCDFCLNVALQDSSSQSRNRSGQSPKSIAARLKLIFRIIKEFQIDNQNVPYLPVVDYCALKIENSSVEVRSAAINLLVEIYKLVGDRLVGDLDGIRPSHMELLQKEFDLISRNQHGNYNNNNNGYHNNNNGYTQAQSQAQKKGTKVELAPIKEQPNQKNAKTKKGK